MMPRGERHETPELSEGGLRSDERDTSEVLIELEREGWEALRTGEGARFYAEILTPDALMIFPDMVMDRDESLAAIARAAPWTSYRIEGSRVLRAGDDGAVVTYRAIGKRGAMEYDAMMTTVYARRDGGWRVLLHQQSPNTSRP